MSQKKLNIAIVGLGFGKEFIPIYQHHPNTNMYAICQRSKDKLDEVGNQYKVAKRYDSFEELIQDPDVDAVHINSPIHLHAPQSVAALKAGKHVACTVPAATTTEDCQAFVDAANAAKKNYMMMETAIYTREFLYVRELRDTGRLGRIPVHAWRPSAGDGWLAWLLGGSSSHALRYARRQPLPRFGKGRSGARIVLRLGQHRGKSGCQIRVRHSP